MFAITLGALLPGGQASANCSADPASFSVISHLNTSYCELCGTGEVRIVLTNPDSQALTSLTVTEDLTGSGLEYVPGMTSINGSPASPANDPSYSNPGQVLSWSATQLPDLAGAPGAGSSYEIVFQVRATTTGTPEDLVTASRQIIASVDFDFQECPLSAPWGRTTDSTGLDTLTLNEPEPTITKLGRNVDALQTGYTATAYGNTNDDMIWQVTVANAGAADLQDLIFSDFMTSNGAESHLTYACPTEAAAEQIAITNNGSGPGTMGCVSITNNMIDPFAKNNFFGNPAAVDVLKNGGTASVYLVGKVASSCNNQTNTVSGVQWGCQTTTVPDGGITQTSAGVTPAPSVATLSTVVDESQLTVTRQFRGSDLGPNVGTKGTVTITITNNTGGTVKNIVLDDVLPSTYYVADPTYVPTITVTHNQAYGNYPGMIDRINWQNQNASLLSNTAPHLILESSTTHPDAGSNLLRHGDVLTINFRVVLINSTYYDKQANLDEPNEAAGVDDPPAIPQLSNNLTIDYEKFCGGAATQLVFNDLFTPQPEDIDVNVDAPIYILTNDTTQRLPMRVTLTNRGGHSAADHYTYVSFGETMTVVSWPTASCSVVSAPPTGPPRPVWNLPAPIPTTATVLQCTSGVIGRNGGTRNYDFEVIKNLASTADDLTFRADVVAEVHLSDGTPLNVPTPSDPIGSTVNNYSLDGIRARVLGFNLLKTQAATCSENPPAGTPDLNVQIGEECSFHIETGGWFGFQTPGFNYIAVENVQVVDQLPVDSQGYISSTDPTLTSDPEIKGISLTAPPAPDYGPVDWRFNVVDRITTKDKWFRVNIDTRILNNPVNSSGLPNQHAALSRNVLNSYFVAIFENASGVEEPFNLGPPTVGYPQAVVRRVDLRVIEPNITVVKEVCNETLHPACTDADFSQTVNDGDTNDTYVYRITLTNEPAASGYTRAPAYDVVATDVLDASDLMLIVQSNGNDFEPFQHDNLDNDGDGLIDEADEGTISENVVGSGSPAQITFSHTHSTALQRIDPGASVRLYYRVDPDDAIAPQQLLTNTVNVTYDSLAGDYGNQSTPQRATGDIAGARVYNATPATATVQILPVLTQPKQILRVSNTGISGPPQPVSIGEEIEYKLTTLIPVSKLRNFVIRDPLPAGIRCVEAPDINLDSGIYLSAGFKPGGTIKPTCTSTGTSDYVEWNFGDQELTTATGTRFSFPVSFIARVENTFVTNTPVPILIDNNAATVSFIDGSGANTLGFGSASAQVAEPQIALTKSFSAASTDAGDVLTVTVTATNTGTATAYNLRVLDNLVGTKMTFLNSVSGTDPPDTIDTTTLGANQPIFSWSTGNPDYAIAPGASKSFTFTVSVDANVEPGEILSNTLQGSWQSLPTQDTALNGSGSIGANGSTMGMRNGAIPNAGDAIDDYETTATATIPVLAASISKTRISDTYDSTPNVRIGDTVTYELRLTLPEGTSSNVVLTDTLPQGLRFEGVVSVNGDTSAPYTSVAPFTYASLSAPAAVGDPLTGPTTVTWNLGQIVNAGDNNAANNDFVIVYRAIVLNNVLPQALNIPLTNTVTLDYTLAGAPAPQQSDTETINVIQPDLVMTKSGPLGVQFGIASTFTLNVQNTGTSRAWDITLLDRLPDLAPAAGGMCDIPPSAFTARVYQADGVTPVSVPLVQGTDFVASFAPAPACTLTFTMQTAAAAVDPTQRLIVTYQATPDNDNLGGVSLTNVAGATAWFSQDTSGAGATGEIGTYTRILTDGTPTVVDHEDALTVVTEVPVLEFRKTVINLTTGQDPGNNASPGDVLRYTITVRNTSSFALSTFNLTDEVDRLSGGTALFAPGTLTNVSVVGGGGSVDTSNTNASGGVLGTGLLDVRNLVLDAAGGANDNLTIQFDVTLAPVINNGVTVLNQAQILIPNYITLVSDNPATATADDPTPTVISSAPILRVRKTSQDMTGDPAVLVSGDTLRYTITVKNIGNENITNATLRDQIPANTTYVANSTMLNGTLVADPAAGVSALQAGMLINAPEDTTPGFLRADPGAGVNNVATVTFDVTINASAINGTVISNQGFVNGSGAGSGAFPEQPTDDPTTAAVNDPTIDVVGNLPLIDSQKTVLLIDGGSGTAGIVDPGDTLRYTITVTNTGATPATGVVITDPIPANTTYVAGSPRLNGAVAGTSYTPFTLTADYGSTYGNLAVGATATLTFDVTVNAGTLFGTVISNQGTITSNEQAPEPTDADGNDSNGDQPTQVVVGDTQQLAINKSVTVVGGGVALPGSELEYTVQVTNISSVAVNDVIITDDMVLVQFSYVPGSATLNGSAAGTSYIAPTLTADYGATYGALAPGATATLRFRALLDGSLAIGTTVTNTGRVDWNSNTQNNSASVSVDIGGTPGVANLNGRVWHDADFGNDFDTGERTLQNWSVDIYRNGVLLDTRLTDANGVYAINGLAPNATTSDQYELRFRAPGASASTASLGLADSVFTNGQQRISDIVVGSGSNTQNLNLPIDPNGVIYDSVSRIPIAGATLTLLQAGNPVNASCFADTAQQNQVTLVDGYYKFDLNFSDGSCPAGGNYTIQVAPPAAGYTAAPSAVIPPMTTAATPYSVSSCANDAITPTPAGYCEAQSSEFAPGLAVPPATVGTYHYLHLTLSTPTPGSSQLFNNHIPLDPVITGSGVSLTKTSPLVNVTRGQLVPYTIIATNNLGGTLTNNDLIDTMPPGFKYVTGSASINGVKLEPAINGRELRWTNQTLVPATPLTLKMMLIIGAGVGEGEYVNQAVVYNNILATNASSVATATVRVVADPIFDCSDVIGKVFDDRNSNGYQDPGEPGIAGARVATVNGLLTTTDKNGRYHIACAAVPDRDRGSNFMLKLDTRSLPSGYRVTTENPRVQRLTRGKLAKMNFGVALQRVVRLDLSDAAFMPVRDQLRPEWEPTLKQVIEQLQQAPSVLRLSYLGDAETAALVQARTRHMQSVIAQQWAATGNDRKLSIETEVFWRNGRPGLARDGISFSRLNGSVRVDDVGDNTEQLIPDAQLTVWARDKSLAVQDGDPVYFSSRTIEQSDTEKARHLPAIPVTNGEPMVTQESVARVREMMKRMDSGQRLRMQFIGYSGRQPLSAAEQKQYGDAYTASMTQARLAADYFRRLLNLTAEQVSIEGRGAGAPTTADAAGRIPVNNRHVDVSVFIEKTSEHTVDEPLIVPRPGVKQLRVCRVESACITVRKKKGARKVEVQQLVPAIRFLPDGDRISEQSVASLQQAFARYRDKPNVQLRFTGHVDALAINAEAVQRYGDKQGLSRAQARVVAEQVQAALGLTANQVEYDGAGDSQPIGINSTATGRALNRRVEVSLWYDAPEDVLSISEPQVCPAGNSPDMIAQRYRPGGQDPIAPIAYRNGKPEIDAAWEQQLKNLLAQLADQPNLRIVFAGYTDKTLLNRRGAIAYGDNWGLAEVRAKQVKEQVQKALNLQPSMLSYEGKGFTDSAAVDQGRVLQGIDGYVEAEIWFDVPAPEDDKVMAELRHIEQSTEPVNPYTLAPMRITVDGKRLDQSLPHQADVQRCTDVALGKTRIKLNFDGHKLEPKLNVAATPVSIAPVDDAATPAADNRVQFQGYSNYPAMIKKAEVRLFRQSQPTDDTPLAVIPLDAQWQGSWTADANTDAELKFLLRVYDEHNRFDETKPKRLWVSRRGGASEQATEKELLGKAYGENTLAKQQIPLSGGTVTVSADSVPAGHQVWIMNQLAPMDQQGKLVTQQIIPKGMHTIEVAVLDDAGNGQVYLRDLNLDRRDWFYAGIADLTVGMDSSSGAAATITGDTRHYNNRLYNDGRLAMYLKGTTGNNVEVTASVDTQEGSLDEIFQDLANRKPPSLFRRMDSENENYAYPTFGDDSTAREDAPTQGKLYLKAKKDDDFALWGNFKAEWLDTDLARIDRGLYGAYGHYEGNDSTTFGQRRTRVDSFVAEPGTVRGRDEFRGTGGSLYYLRHQDITQGSDSVWVEVRDADSGMVLKTNRLLAGQDYSIDPLQGRLQLTSPLPSTADDSQLVKSGSLSGHPVYLVVHYEYAPGLDALDDTSVGLRGSRWLNDRIKLGLTYNNEQQLGQQQTLGAVDLTWRKSEGTYVKLESAQTDGPGLGEYQSVDGGYNFNQVPQDLSASAHASANRIEVSAQLSEFMDKTRGKFGAYFQQRERGFSAQGQLTASDTTQYGGLFNMPVGERSDINFKLDAKDIDLGLQTEALSVDYGHAFDKRWKMTTGIRHDRREDHSLVVPVTQTEGERTDGAVRITYDSEEQWKAFGYAQATLAISGTRDDNNRLGGGGEYQVSKRFKLHGDLSTGDLGMGAKFGADYLLRDDTNLYSTYALDNERDVSGLRTTRGNFVNGFRSKTSDSMSVYGEERYVHGDVPTGLTHAYGVDLTPNKEWRFGANVELGRLSDPTAGLTTDRTAFGLSAGHTNDTFKYTGAFEYRFDDMTTSSRTSYLLKNKLTYQTDPNWRLFGKVNLSESVSTLGAFYDGRFIESVFGYALRPVDNDRWNIVFKYSYLYNVPTADQVAVTSTAADYLQRSQVLAVDTGYDLTRQWTIGAKLAYRLGQLSMDRVNPQFFDSRGQLLALRADWHVVRNWDVMLEGRMRQEIDAGDVYTGMLLGGYRHIGNNLKIGVGYNFSDFSDDLTNMDFNSQGLFINVIGKF